MNKNIKYWDDEIVARHIGTELNWLFEYLDDNNITNISFIDIGGNVGKFYDELSKKYKIDKCVIVEASNKLCDYMKNKFSNNESVEIHNVAISDKEGYFEFNDSGIDYWNDKDVDESINLGLSKLSNSSGQTKCILINTFLENYNTILPSDITFIKIDTENRDIPILGGMIDYLIRHNIKPFILFENNYHNDMSYDDAQLILDTFSEKCGYEKVNLKTPGDSKITPKK